MFEKLRIKQHMEVAGSDGEHVATVDSVEGETIKLTKSGFNDNAHHFPLFDRVEENRLYLQVSKGQAIISRV